MLLDKLRECVGISNSKPKGAMIPDRLKGCREKSVIFSDDYSKN